MRRSPRSPSRSARSASSPPRTVPSPSGSPRAGNCPCPPARESPAGAAGLLSAELFTVAARDLPDDAEAIDRVARVWAREARLAPRLLMGTAGGGGGGESGGGGGRR